MPYCRLFSIILLFDKGESSATVLDQHQIKNDFQHSQIDNLNTVNRFNQGQPANKFQSYGVKVLSQNICSFFQ